MQRLYLVLRPESGERSVEEKQDPEAKKEESDSVKHGSGSSEGGRGSKLAHIFNLGLFLLAKLFGNILIFVYTLTIIKIENNYKGVQI